LPIAQPSLGTDLGRAAPELVANHPSNFQTALPATYSFSPGHALVVEGQIGRGYFVALADPSVLINNMLEIDSNRAFARALIRRTCRAGQDRILMFTQRFENRGEPAPTGSEQSVFARFNQMLTGINAALIDASRDGRVLAAAAALAALIVVMLLVGAF